MASRHENKTQSQDKNSTGSQEGAEEVDAHFDDGFDENLMAGEDDRQRLAFMSERQREIELYNRAQRREALLARFTVRQKLMQKKIAQQPPSGTKETPVNEVTSSSRESSGADLAKDESAETTTKRKETAHSVALERLVAERKRRRMEKEALEECAAKNETSFSSNSDNSSDEDSAAPDEADKKGGQLSSHDESEDESQAEDAEHRRKSTTTISTKEQLSKFRLSRFKLANWCHAPFFREVAIGSFVKIGVGVVNGQSVYRIGEIVDIITIQKPYDFENTRTDKVVRLRHSNSERNFKMAFVSNSPFTDSEFDRWIHTMTIQKQPIPTLEQMELKESTIKYYVDYVYMDEDIEQIVKEKIRLKLRPTNFAVARADLKLQMDVAKENRDYETLTKLEEQMRELDRLATEARKDASLAKLDEINRRNRQSTLVNVEAALLRDAKENKHAKPDPFTRRRCLPTIVTKSRCHPPPDSSTDEGTRDAPSENSATEQQEGEIEKNSCQKEPPKDPLAEVDLFSIHNFDLDIEMPSIDPKPAIVTSHVPTPPKTMCQPTPATSSSSVTNSTEGATQPPANRNCANKRMLNLEEYKRRRGLL